MRIVNREKTKERHKLFTDERKSWISAFNKMNRQELLICIFSVFTKKNKVIFGRGKFFLQFHYLQKPKQIPLRTIC